jgi:hydrogenase maturation protease
VTERVLVAGVGNVFFGDDAFGPEVVWLLQRDPPPGAKLEDFGIRGLHLAYELLAGYERAILVDATPRGGAPGSVYVIEPNLDEAGGAPDAHRMDLQNVFAFVRSLGGEAPPITLVGCEPETIAEGIGLSATVSQSVRTAAPLVRRLIQDALALPAGQDKGEKETSWSEA